MSLISKYNRWPEDRSPVRVFMAKGGPTCVRWACAAVMSFWHSSSPVARRSFLKASNSRSQVCLKRAALASLTLASPAHATTVRVCISPPRDAQKETDSFSMAEHATPPIACSRNADELVLLLRGELF